jgi:hypothetical protein
LKGYIIRFIGTILAAAIFIILIGYLYFFETREKSEIDKKENVFPVIKAEQINEIIFKYPTYTVACLKEGGSWFILKDSKRFKADSVAIRNMIENITQIRIEKVASETQDDLAEFGLEKPKAEVIVNTQENKYQLSIGNDSPVDSGTYVLIYKDNRVLIVSRGSIQEFLKKTANDLRDKQVLSLDEDKINRVRFTWEGVSFEVERKNNNWIDKNMPTYLEIDVSRVWAILNTFLKLKVDNFEDDEPQNLSVYGLDKPSAEIELFENEKAVRVLFGNKKGPHDYYLKLGSQDPVYSVNEFVLRQIPENVNDIRMRRIIKMDIEKISGIEIKKGDINLSILKEGKKWKLGGENDKKADESKVIKLMAELGGLEVEKFIDDKTKGLSFYGLDKPSIEITISGPGNRIILLFGKKENQKVYAKVADRESVYLLNDVILSKIPSSKNELIEK